MQEINELISRLAINKVRMAKALGISRGYFGDLLNGRKKPSKVAEMRQYLRNYATEILNFLEK